MSPFMFLIVVPVVIGVVVFLFGLLARKRKIIILSAPAALLFVAWLVLASLAPNAQKEFDQRFGADNRAAASGIKTFKPTFMDGCFISFYMHRSDFDARIRPKFSDIE